MLISSTTRQVETNRSGRYIFTINHSSAYKIVWKVAVPCVKVASLIWKIVWYEKFVSRSETHSEKVVHSFSYTLRLCELSKIWNGYFTGHNVGWSKLKLAIDFYHTELRNNKYNNSLHFISIPWKWRAGLLYIVIH